MKLGRVTAVIGAHDRWEATLECAASLQAGRLPGDPELEIVVIGLRRAEVTTVAEHAIDLGVIIGPTGEVDRTQAHALGLELASSDVVVFASDLLSVSPGWLGAMLARLTPDVRGVGALVRRPTGALHSAGLDWPDGRELPQPMLTGFPVEDGERVRDLRFPALAAPLLMLRTAEARRGRLWIRGNYLGTIDLTRQLANGNPGSYVVEPSVIAVARRTPQPRGELEPIASQKAFRRRWKRMRAPDLWPGTGFVTRREADSLSVTRPLLTVTEGVPRLRWAIKNPAFAAEGESWGDTHFARAIAAALRRRGQEVVVDYRLAWERESAPLDDVTLCLRGLAEFRPLPDQTSLLWVISHPELVTDQEAAAFDVLLAASETWAAERSRAWGRPVQPLLQATDPDAFAPPERLGSADGEVLFVGTSHGRLRPIVGWAQEAGAPLAVYGGRWQGIIPDALIRGDYLPNHELAAAYGGAGVVLNDHWDHMRDLGFVSNRLFDTVAAGARVITDPVAADLAPLFGDSVQIAHDAATLAALLAELAADPDRFGDAETRRARAEQVRREHSFDARAQTLLDSALAARSGSPRAARLR